MLLKEKDLKIQRNIYDYRFAPKFNIFKSVSGILDCFVDDLQLLVIFQLFVSFYVVALNSSKWHQKWFFFNSIDIEKKSVFFFLMLHVLIL